MPFPIFDKQEDVPEAIRSEYEEREDGKWHAKVPDVEKLNTAIEKERTRATEEEKARKKAEKERDDLKRKETANQHGITDEQLEQLRTEDAQKRKPIEDENATLKAEIRQLKLTERVQRMALDAGVMKERLDDAMLHLEKRIDLTADGDGLVVKDKTGKATTETVEDFLSKTFKEEKPWAYEGSGASGSGSLGSGGGGNTTPAGNEKQLEKKRSEVVGAF